MSLGTKYHKSHKTLDLSFKSPCKLRKERNEIRRYGSTIPHHRRISDPHSGPFFASKCLLATVDLELTLGFTSTLERTYPQYNLHEMNQLDGMIGIGMHSKGGNGIEES
jgi:hypothetical protein